MSVVPDTYDQLMFIEMIVRSKHLPRIPRDIVWHIWKHYFLVDLVKRFAEIMGEKFGLTMEEAMQMKGSFRLWTRANNLSPDFFLLLRQRWFVGFFPEFGNTTFHRRCAMNYAPYCSIMYPLGLKFSTVAGISECDGTHDPKFKRLFAFGKDVHKKESNKRIRV